jgi:hypothetical protein
MTMNASTQGYAMGVDVKKKQCEVGDKEYLVEPERRIQWGAVVDGFVVLLRERVVKDVETELAFSESEDAANKIAKALNELEGL